MRSLLAATLALAGLAAANPVPPSARYAKRAVLPPSQDPFYTPPAGYENTAPGTVLASRQVQTAFGTLIPTIGVTSYQVLYRTTGAEGEPGATVATIFKPMFAQSNVLVGYATAEDSAYLNCAPSYNYQLGGGNTDSIVQFEEAILATAIAQGWTVVSTDYEGHNASFAAGRLSGHGVLDGLRATLNFGPAGLSKNSKVAQFGYSGGAIASGWAASLQPTYASELNMVGWAIGGTPANVSGTLQYLDGGLFSGFGFGGTSGLISAYPELNSYYQQVATAEGKAAVEYCMSHCATDDISEFAFKRLQSSTYTTLGDRLLYDPKVQSVTSQNTMGTSQNITPSAPIYLYHSNTDEIIPIADATALVHRWCDQYNIKSLVYEIDIGPSEHASLEILGVPSVISFLHARIAGEPAQQGCKISDVVLPVPPATALGTASIPALTALLTALTTTIGIDDSILKSKFQK